MQKTKDIITAFQSMDVDNRGYLTINDVDVLREQGFTITFVERLFETHASLDGNHMIYNDFLIYQIAENHMTVFFFVLYCICGKRFLFFSIHLHSVIISKFSTFTTKDF